jgi:hypothetical protein
MARPADVVERVMALPHERLDESLRFLRPDAEWRPGPGQPVLRGHEEIRTYVVDELRRLGPDVPQPVPSMLFERERVVLVYGQLKIPRRGMERPYTEVQPIAWVYELEGDLIARVAIFDDWEMAREAAGVPLGTPPTRTLGGELWRPAVALPGRSAAELVRALRAPAVVLAGRLRADAARA